MISVISAAIVVLGIGAAYDLRTTGSREAWIPGWIPGVMAVGTIVALVIPLVPRNLALLGLAVGITGMLTAVFTAGGGLDDVLLAGVAGTLLGPWGAAAMLLLAGGSAWVLTALARRVPRLRVWLHRWAAYHRLPVLDDSFPVPFIPCMALGAAVWGLILMLLPGSMASAISA